MRCFEPRISVTKVGLRFRRLRFRGDQFGPQSVLLVADHIERESVRVLQTVGGQAATPRLDLLNFAEALLGVFALVRGEQAELLDQLRLEGRNPLSELRHPLPVVAGQFLLKPLGPQIGQFATFAPVPGGAHEVVICPAVAGDFREQQPLAAKGAVHRSLDVMLVTPGAIAALGSTIEDLLHAIKESIRNEARVRSLVFDALPDDDSLVIRIAEEAVQRRPTDFARSAPAGVAPQATLV